MLIMTATQAQAALDPPLCERSVGLQRVILELTPEDDHCGNFPENVVRELTELDATNKGIGSLKAGDFEDFDSLNILILHGNPLRRLPRDVFCGLGAMSGENSELNLTLTELYTISGDVFRCLGDLQLLGLWGNRLKTLPAGAFRPLGELRVLNLGSNGMTSFHVDAFEGLGKLRELHLHNNLLETLPDRAWLIHLGIRPGRVKAQANGRLQKLRLSGNRLRELGEHPFAAVRQTMRQLLLDNNRLTWLPQGIFEGMNLNPVRSRIDVTDGFGNVRLRITEGILPGALRLDGDDQGDNDPWNEFPSDASETAANPNHGNYDSAITDETFTLPMYMWIELKTRKNNQGQDRYWYDNSGVRMPHAAPFDLNISWTRTRNFASEDWIFTERVTGLDAGKYTKFLLNSETPDQTGSDITFSTNNTAISIRWSIHARSQDSEGVVLMNHETESNTFCGFDPCYDGFGFAANWVYHHSDDGLNVQYPRMHVDVGGDSSTKQDGHFYPVFLSSPADSNGYVAGEDVEVAVRYERGPLAKFAPIRVTLRIGNTDRTANWLPTNVVGRPKVVDREALRFRYRVQEADRGLIRIASVSGNSSIGSDYRQPGIFRDGKTFIPDVSAHAAGGPDGNQSVQAKTYVSFVSGTESARAGERDIFAKEGESFDLEFRVTPAPASDLNVPYRMNQNFSDVRQADWTNSPGRFKNGGTVTVGPDGMGTISIGILDTGGGNEDPEVARVHVRVQLVDTDDYDLGERHTVRVHIKEGVCDRTPGVRDGLMAATERRDCADVTNDDLASIVELDLSNRGISSLKPKDFLGLDRLMALDLSDNRLSGVLPKNIFEDIHVGGSRYLDGVDDTLTALNLQNNDYEEVPEELFHELEDLSLNTFFIDDNDRNEDFRLQFTLEFAGEPPDLPLAAGDTVNLKLVLPQGAPYEFSVDVHGDNLEATAYFARGATDSEEFEWDLREDTTTLEVTLSNLQRLSGGCVLTNSDGDCFSGIEIVTGEKLTLGGVRVRVRVFLENALE